MSMAYQSIVFTFNICTDRPDSEEQSDTRFDMSIYVLIDFSLTVKAAILIFISERSSAISSAKEGKSGFIYNLVKC